MVLALASLPASADSGDADAGRVLYERNECAGCHETAAIPGMLVVPLGGLANRYSESELMAVLEAPVPPMPDFDLSEPERRQLVAYLRARFP